MMSARYGITFSKLMDIYREYLHYSALIGYDDAEETFLIADPYGKIKNLNKQEFLMPSPLETSVYMI